MFGRKPKPRQLTFADRVQCFESRLSRLENQVSTLSDAITTLQGLATEVQTLVTQYEAAQAALAAAAPTQEQIDAINQQLAATKSTLDGALNPTPAEPAS